MLKVTQEASEPGYESGLLPAKPAFFPLCCSINAACSPLSLWEDVPIQKGVGWQPPKVEGSPLGQNRKKSCYCGVPGKEASMDYVPCLFQQLPSTLPSLPGQHQACLYSCPGGVPAETAALPASFRGILTPSQSWMTSWLQPKMKELAHRLLFIFQSYLRS